MENPRLFLLKITAMISLAILIVNPFVSGALVQAQTTFESIDEGLYTNSRGIPTSETVSGWRRVGPYLDTATNMTIQKYQLQVNYTGAQFSVLYERSNGTEQTYGNPISQEAVFINMHWLDTAGNLQSGYAIVGLPSIYNDTNGNGVFDRVYTKNETHVSNVSYPDKPIARKSEMNNPIPEFGAPTTTTNAQGIKETYFNITFPNAVSGDGIKKWKDYGGIVDDNAALLPGDTKWTITYGFHVMNDNSKLKVKFDLKIVLTDLSVPALGSGDFINIEVPWTLDINASLVQANDANTKLTFTASGNLDLGAFEMGTKYDYASTAGSATNLTMGAARRLLFYGDDNKIQPNGWVELCTNFRLPYANGTTLIYDPEMIIPFRAPSTIDGTPLGWFVFAAGIGVAMLLVKKRVR